MIIFSVKKFPVHINRDRSIIILSIIISIFGVYLNGQSSVNSTGGNATGDGGKVSYSIGQVIFNSFNSSSGSILEGVQQPFEILVISSIPEAERINITSSIYPNPTSGFIILDISECELSDLTYVVFDTNGKMIKFEKILKDKTSIDLSNFTGTTYFIRLFQNNTNEVKTYKIIMN